MLNLHTINCNCAIQDCAGFMILLVDQVESDELHWNVLDKSCRKEEQRCHPVQKCKHQIAPADFSLCLLSAHPFESAATRWYTAKIYQRQHDGKPVANLHSRLGNSLINQLTNACFSLGNTIPVILNPWIHWVLDDHHEMECDHHDI